MPWIRRKLVPGPGIHEPTHRTDRHADRQHVDTDVREPGDDRRVVRGVAGRA